MTQETVSNFYPYIFDIALVVIVIACVIYGSIKGFLTMFVAFVGRIAAVILALILCNVLANYAYTAFIKPQVTETVSSKVEEVLTNDKNAQVTEIITKATEGMPEFVKNSALSCSDLLTVKDEQKAEISNTIEQSVISPIVLSALQIVIFIILLTIFLIIVKFLSKTFGEINDWPIVGKLNKFLGGVLGLVNAMIIVLVAVFVIKGAVLLSGNNSKVFNNETIESSKIFSYIYKQDFPKLEKGE